MNGAPLPSRQHPRDSCESLEDLAAGIEGERGEALRVSAARLQQEVVSERARTGALRRSLAEAVIDVALARADLVEAREDAERVRREAESSGRAKSLFLANMSHEIRTPMTAILGYAELLLDPGLSSSDREEHVQIILRQGRHLLSLLNDILDLSKIESGKMTVEKIACSPCQIVSDVASLMRVRAAEKFLPLDVEYEGRIPQKIQSDPTRIRQILMNLIGNAIKFTSEGRVRLRTWVGKTPEGEGSKRLFFAVEDSGIGLDEAQRARLFHPFTQADSSTTREFGGTGLGLTISLRLAELLGGAITVDSRPGRGSTFTVVIDPGPLDGVAMAEVPYEVHAGPVPEATPAKASSRVGGRVLLVEDGPDNQRLISFLLKRAGASVDVAENGKVGVEKVLEAVGAGSPYDLVLMDMQMPVLDGYAAATKLRHEGYGGTIIALTAHAMRDDREKCLAAGCDDFLTKPIQHAKLLATVRARIADAYPPVRGGGQAAVPRGAASETR